MGRRRTRSRTSGWMAEPTLFGNRSTGLGTQGAALVGMSPRTALGQGEI